MTEKELRERLFTGIYPTGIVYADRERDSGGDYARLGFLPFDTLALKLNHDCPADFAALLRQDAERIQARAGEEFEITTSGQTIQLGSAGPVFVPISQDRFDAMLGAVPPHCHSPKGFLLGEAWTLKNGADAFRAFVQRGDAFYECTSPLTSDEFRAVDPATIKVA